MKAGGDSPGDALEHIARYIDQVAHHGARRRHHARSLAVQKNRIRGVAHDVEGVVISIHVRQKVVEGNHRRMNPSLYKRLPLSCDGEKLYLVSEFLREFYVLLRNSRYPFAVNVFKPDLLPVGERQNDSEFVRRVDSLDVKSRIGLCKPEVLCLSENGIECLSLIGHFGQNIVRCSVHDAEYGSDPVRDKTFLQGLDYGNGSAHARFKSDVHIFFFRGLKYFIPVRGQQGLVGCYHMFFLPHGVDNE